MGTVWSSGYILTVSGEGNTPETMYTDIGDDTIISKSLANGYPEYFIDGVKGRYVYVAADAVLTIGDESDYSYREALYQTWNGTNYYTRFNISQGGSLHVFGNVDLILNYGCTSTQYTDYSYWDGNFLLSGSDNYQPNIRGARNFQMRAILTDLSYMKNQYWIINKVKMGECLTTPVCAVTFATHIPPTMSFSNITQVQDSYNAYMSFMSCVFDVPTLDMPTVDNLVFSGSKPQYATVISYGVRWLNTVFSSSANTYIQSVYGFNRSYTYNTTTIDGAPRQEKAYKLGQFFSFMFEDSDISAPFSYHSYNQQTMLALYKNFPNNANKSALCYFGAQAICWYSDNVFNRVVLDDYNAAGKKVYLLDLTIVDINNKPIDDVIVDIQQNEDKERYMCRTDETGKIIAMNGIGGVLLANQMRISSAETLSTISSGSNGTYHIVKIYKDGYKSKTFNIEMDTDKTMIVKLNNLYSSGIINKIQGN